MVTSNLEDKVATSYETVMAGAITSVAAIVARGTVAVAASVKPKKCVKMVV